MCKTLAPRGHTTSGTFFSGYFFTRFITSKNEVGIYAIKYAIKFIVKQEMNDGITA